MYVNSIPDIVKAPLRKDYGHGGFYEPQTKHWWAQDNERGRLVFHYSTPVLWIPAIGGQWDIQGVKVGIGHGSMSDMQGINKMLWALGLGRVKVRNYDVVVAYVAKMWVDKFPAEITKTLELETLTPYLLDKSLRHAVSLYDQHHDISLLRKTLRELVKEHYKQQGRPLVKVKTRLAYGSLFLEWDVASMRYAPVPMLYDLRDGRRAAE